MKRVCFERKHPDLILTLTIAGDMIAAAAFQKSPQSESSILAPIAQTRSDSLKESIRALDWKLHWMERHRKLSRQVKEVAVGPPEEEPFAFLKKRLDNAVRVR